MKYSAADLATMARTVEHARFAEPPRYRALVEAIHRRSGLRRYDIAERITRLAQN